MPKNFEDISCIFCGERNTTEDIQCISCKEPLSIYDHLIKQQVDNLTLIEYAARGFYGLTFKAVDAFSKCFAVKLISQSSYLKHGKDFEEEAEKYAYLPDIPTLARYIRAGKTSLTYDSKQMDFYYIVSEWIDGMPLSEFLNSSDIEPEDLLIASKDLLTTLEELNELNMWHNDLHDENILISSVSPSQMRLFERTIPRIYKIIDIGSMVYRNPGDVKICDDITNVGSHLSQISNALKLKFSTLSKEDQFFVNLIDDSCAQLMDEEPHRYFSRPIDALNQIEDYFRLSRRGKSEELKRLASPYGYINANDIPSSWLLKEMFSNKLSYFNDIMHDDQQCLLITGPRGCGKTMILKNMRFLTIYDASEEKSAEFIEAIQYVGLFISARTNFGNYLVSFRSQDWINHEEKVMFYFNILVTLEMLDILYRLFFDNHVPENCISVVMDFLSERFSTPYISLNIAKAKLVEISRNLIAGRKIQINIENSTPAYLNDLLDTFRSTIPLIRNKTIIIMVDDLSLPRVPEIIQKAILPSIFNTGAEYKTRVTSHSEGIITQDNAGEVYSRNRDYVEINLGYEYWKLSDDYERCRDSFNDIMSKRFRLSGREDFPGIEAVLSKGDILEDIGREIYRLKENNNLRSLNYHGSKVFIKLCTGDLSYLLDILGKMEFRNKDKGYPIGERLQNEVIRNYARNELLKLQDIKAAYVSSLYNIAYAFGVLSKSKLINKNADYLKIEVELQNLAKELHTTLRELLCYGIFIDAGSGNNSSGKMCKKLFFRRIYTPAFPTTFITRNSFSWRAKSFKKFVFEPLSFLKENMSKDKLSVTQQHEMEQLDIF